MTHLNNTMNTATLTTHRKFTHLSKDERIMITTLKNEGLSNRAIGRRLGVHQMINNEIERGTVKQIRRQKQAGTIYEYSYRIYSYEAGHRTYLSHHRHSGRHRLYQRSQEFLRLADQLMLGQFDGHRYSPQAVLYKAPGLISDAALIPKSVVTLYQWINEGVCQTTNLDLFEKARRQHHHRHRPVKRGLGANISQRPAAANERTEIGHWEVDTVRTEEPPR